jgi:hypothetical protein
VGQRCARFARDPLSTADHTRLTCTRKGRNKRLAGVAGEVIE